MNSSNGPADSPDSRPVVSVIIISYNTREMTAECLGALFRDLGDLPAEVLVVDNASTDASVEMIREQFPQVSVIANRQNVGFGSANNRAMSRARGEFIMLLNSDAFVKVGTTPTLVEYLRTHPESGVVGPQLLNADGTTQQSCFRFPSPLRCWMENLWLNRVFRRHTRLGDYSEWAHDEEREVEWVVGACMLLRREVFERVGGFDEAFFMYSEETDWQKRIRKAGWAIVFTPAAQVTHVGGASGAREKAKVDRYFFESLDRYELKHHGVLGLISLRVAMVLGCAMRAVMWLMVLLFVPWRREKARVKARLLSWLVLRQMTRWQVSSS